MQPLDSVLVLSFQGQRLPIIVREGLSPLGYGSTERVILRPNHRFSLLVNLHKSGRHAFRLLFPFDLAAVSSLLLFNADADS